MGQKFRAVANYDFNVHKVGTTINVEGHGPHVIIAVSPIPDGKANFVLEKIGDNRKKRRAKAAEERK